MKIFQRMTWHTGGDEKVKGQPLIKSFKDGE